MTETTAGLFNLEDDVDLTVDYSNRQLRRNEENHWIDELRVVLERGCDLGSIRNIVQCRPLTEDLRLQTWKVRHTRFVFISRKILMCVCFWKICLGLNESDHEYQYIDSDSFDLPEQNIIRDDISRLKRKCEQQSHPQSIRRNIFSHSRDLNIEMQWYWSCHYLLL